MGSSCSNNHEVINPLKPFSSLGELNPRRELSIEVGDLWFQASRRLEGACIARHIVPEHTMHEYILNASILHDNMILFEKRMKKGASLTELKRIAECSRMGVAA